MNINCLNGETMSREQIDAYLERLNMDPPVQLDLEYLSRLQLAHLQRIPFENLDILAGKLTSLDHQVLFEKIINNKRGGVCAELNTLYNWLLDSLGFQVISHSSRLIAEAAPFQIRRHRVMEVSLGDKRYLTDVGINFEYSRCPLLMEDGVVQFDGMCEYKLTRDAFFGWIMWQKRPGYDWRRKIGFTEEPQLDLDFMLACYYYDTHPDSTMNKFPKVSFYAPDCFYAIRNHEFLVERCDIPVSVTPIPSAEEERRLIEDFFHLHTPD